MGQARRQVGYRRFQSAPLLRGATPHHRRFAVGQRFQSAPLLRGATGHIVIRIRLVAVSIRAPLARGDGFVNGFSRLAQVSIRAPLARGDERRLIPFPLTGRFNPRPSCEGRPLGFAGLVREHMFQSAPLLRGATACQLAPSPPTKVSIRAPLARGDRDCREPSRPRLVSIRAPLARGDDILAIRGAQASGFNPRPSCEGRPP